MRLRQARAIVVCSIALAGSAAVAEPRPTAVIVDPPARAEGEPAEAAISRIIFLNRCAGGCTFRESDTTDSRYNRTTLGTGGPGQAYALTEFGYGDASWAAIVACFTELYAPYDVMVTDVDPGIDVPHHETVITGGYADELGHDPLRVGGVGPLFSDCSLHDNTVSFTFGAAYGDNPQELCATAGQETGHAFGLEHSYNCADPMTYLDACGLQFFRNEFAECGEYEPRGCMCLGSGQNTHSRLKAALGTNPVPLPAPATSLSAPTAGAQVSAGFPITVTAIDRRGLSKLELWFNGWRWVEADAQRGAETFTLPAPSELPDGIIDVEVRAYNDLHTVYGSATVTVTKGAACTAADTCLPGQRCDQGRCLWDPPTGELGAACEYNEFCVSNICDYGECSQPCGGAVVCPTGFVCVDQAFCHPASSDDGGGCCSTGSAPSSGALLAQIGLAGVILAGIRRRRRR